MKQLLLYSLLLLFFTNCKNNGAAIPVKVKAIETYQVDLNKDIEYAKGLSHDSLNSASATTMPLLLDIYTPVNNIKKRPVFLFIHGGGFAGGTKQQSQIKKWADYYASRGWVFISMDYRLKKHKGTLPENFVKFSSLVPQAIRAQYLAIYPAQRDAKAALRWVAANAKKYNIDTNYITVGGASAGAITALTVGISNPEDYRDELTLAQDPTLDTTNPEQSYTVKTIVNLWGAKYGLDALDKIYGHKRFDKNDPPLFIAHGTADPVVPYSDAEDLKELYNKNKIPLAYYPIENKGHGVWNAKIDDKTLEKLAFDFIVEQQKLVVE